ncbi:MAG: hypothetical protein HYV09_03590 [Deltaproteobacteria bacterium]|nr:hypothetical protein [Deltaproteobacteria bacterium]
MKRTVPLAAFALALASCLVSCDDHEHASDPADPCSETGAWEKLAVTDEACRAFVAAETRGEIVIDASKAPRLTNPTPGAIVPAAPVPRFTWSAGVVARTPWNRLLRALHPIGTAWAHGETIGLVHVLVFRDGAKKELHRVLTPATDYTPGAAHWERLRAAGKVEVTLYAVRFAANAIAAGTRPVGGEPQSFTIE